MAWIDSSEQVKVPELRLVGEYQCDGTNCPVGPHDHMVVGPPAWTAVELYELASSYCNVVHGDMVYRLFLSGFLAWLTKEAGNVLEQREIPRKLSPEPTAAIIARLVKEVAEDEHTNGR